MVLLLFLFPVCATYGQQTVFDVPSADVLDKGKVYGELDGTVRAIDPLATFTPRVVVGIGNRIEAGMNFNGMSAPTVEQLDISLTVKWRLWRGKHSGWSFYIGDDLFPHSQPDLRRGKLFLRILRERVETWNANRFWRIRLYAKRCRKRQSRWWTVHFRTES